MRVAYLNYGITLVLSLGFLSACSDDGTPHNFAPVDYSYLPQLHLNVATIDVQDQATAMPDSLSAQAPTPPDQALKLMATQRLVATGGAGAATFVITQAAIDRDGSHALSGNMDVTLNIHDASGSHTGLAHAHVTRHLDGGDHDPASQTALYDMTNQMMQDMNVELAFQIHRSLRPWLTDAAGTPLEGGVKAQSLDAPGSTAATTPNPALSPDAASKAVPATDAPTTTNTKLTAPAVPTTPDAIFPTGTDPVSTAVPVSPMAPSQSSTPVVHSPKAGVLTLPSSINPAAAPH